MTSIAITASPSIIENAGKLTLEAARDFDVIRRLKIPRYDPHVPLKFRSFYGRLWWIVQDGHISSSHITERMLKLSDAVFEDTPDRNELADLFLADLADWLDMGSSTLIIQLSQESVR